MATDTHGLYIGEVVVSVFFPFSTDYSSEFCNEAQLYSVLSYVVD